MQNCWTVLSDRAKTGANAAQAAVVQARARIAKLQGSLDHINKLRDDYIARYADAQKEAHMIGDNIAYRQFLEHLHGLGQRVFEQVAGARFELEQAQKTWEEAQRQQAKMDAMVERDARNTAQTIARREQKEIDAAGITLFNLNLR
jgi:flagellar export protein FliJ